MTPGLASPSNAATRTALLARDGLSRLLTGAAPLDLARLADMAGLALLLLATATLLFRPADLFPFLAGAPLYESLVGLCFVVSLPRVVPQLSARSLTENAVTAMFVLLVPAVMLSHLAHANTYDARLGGLGMMKASLLFLLVVGLVDSPRRLVAMLAVVLTGVLAMTALAVAQHHGLLSLPALQSIQQRTFDPESPVLTRLCGIGVFNDPNDYALILVAAVIICLSGLGERRAGRARWLMLGPLALLAYALVLTHSRGGVLAALAALLAFLPARFGWRNTLPLIVLLVPMLLAPFWDRLTDLQINNPEDTFQARLELWNHSLDAFRSAPLLGIGQGKLVDTIGQVAHNSYLHAFAEMGLLGGTAFIGAFALIIRALWRAVPSSAAPPEARLARLRPYMLAITVGYAAGLLSLSRCYTVPTQLIPALATAYLVLASRAGGVPLPHMSSVRVLRLTGLGLAFLMATLLFVRLVWQGGQA